ncbi:MAG: hypothetical protein NZ561_06200, partial [Phycisphaerae bacterium]|nr:hypothetical protein [Phycisphaerae bacterium]
ERNQKVIDANRQLAPDRPEINSPWELQQQAARQTLARFEEEAAQLRWWHGLFRAIKAPLPKTSETVDLMSRWLVEPEPMLRAREESARQEARRRQERQRRRGAATTAATQRDRAEWNPDDPAVMQRVQAELGARRAVTILGTSLAFEACVLGVAAWIFCRRDY